MKYVEASKLIQKLSNDYSTVKNVFGSMEGYSVFYKGKLVAYVSTYAMYGIYPANAYLYKLPYGNKLWMILSELSMTKISDRLNEPKYNVIIANNPGKDIMFPFEVWKHDSDNIFYLTCVEENELRENNNTIFSEDEYAKLIKYIKTLPDGEFQAKVAEHGKTLIKEED
ncbi:hypothetical protein HWC08_gp002 [Lactobacillus phage 521B]|uniref:Uncharacterized protein n=1 Tax=Lactobacillus phage 521B TaxID=2510942 RepID=A0A4Y5FEA9_9CAUD|nr:hypothetical protein HWC08_gp002 [Lactobacillus phage 521B]QBJ03352.1 hypothetical protein B521_0002 [Lactobacillus phage 521B]